MSYEGEVELLCEKGHYSRIGAHEDMPYLCEQCSGLIQYMHPVDLTNGYNSDYPGTRYIEKIEIGYDDDWCIDHHGNKYAKKIVKFGPAAVVPSSRADMGWVDVKDVSKQKQLKAVQLGFVVTIRDSRNRGAIIGYVLHVHNDAPTATSIVIARKCELMHSPHVSKEFVYSEEEANEVKARFVKNEKDNAMLHLFDIDLDESVFVEPINSWDVDE